MPDINATRLSPVKTSHRRNVWCVLILTMLIAAWAWPTHGQDNDNGSPQTPTGTPNQGDVEPQTDAKPTAGADKETEGDAKKDEKTSDDREEIWLEEVLNGAFNKINGFVAGLLFWDASFGAIEYRAYDSSTGAPKLDDEGNPKTQGPFFIVVFLALGSIFFTLWYGFINVRGFRHSIKVIRGHYDNPEDEGQISHFKALTSALSATIGLGNIAGVAIAVKAGGPGAVLWMMILAVFGMTAKFSECTLAQMYRKINDKGEVSGGPMYYLDVGFKEKGPTWGIIGKVLAVLFAVLVMFAALGGGNMFQSNQAFEAFRTTVQQANGGDPMSHGTVFAMSAVFGVVMAAVVGVVILGGITRIGEATSKIVPTMCGLYVVASLVIILTHITSVPEAISTIVREAFNTQAAAGGIMGVLIIGFQRAAFSNEAGIGSAAIAHSAAKTKEPVREGIVAMIGPFIDTIVICLMTGIVVTISDAYINAPEGANGAGVTMHAFQSSPALAGWFPYVLTVCIVLFAFSTMISWCYYGERGWGYLFGLKSVTAYRIVFVICVFIGAVAKLGGVIDFSDLMLLGMAFPNIIGGIILAPKVKEKLHDYWSRYKSGEMPVYDGTDSGPVKPKGGAEFDI